MIDIEIKCDVCGESLGNADVSNNTLWVEPCDKCLTDAESKGYKDGVALAEEPT